MPGQRHIPIGRTYNFRDLGGYATADGKSVTRWRRLYRSDTLGRAAYTLGSMKELTERLNVGCAIDLRSSTERQRDPYNIPGVEVFSLPVEPGDIMKEMTSSTCDLTEEVGVRCMTKIYCAMVRDYKSVYARFFSILVEKADRGIVFHCTAGKDRTGYASALLLLVLGVPLETVFEDFLLSNMYFRQPTLAMLQNSFPARKVEEGALDALFRVRRPFLQSALDIIDKEYGGVNAYVRNELQVTEDMVSKLKAAFLQPCGSPEEAQNLPPLRECARDGHVPQKEAANDAAPEAPREAPPPVADAPTGSEAPPEEPVNAET